MPKSKVSQPKVYPDGRFSRRFKTAENHEKAKALRLARESEGRVTAAVNAMARAERNPAEQLAELDRRLGKGVGAKRERARLKRQLGKR